jgi:regulator of cell morphogenesis and NO signaling
MLVQGPQRGSLVEPGHAVEREFHMPLNADCTVGQVVVERPGRSRVLERLGIDYCCGGRKPLQEACRERGLTLDFVLHELESDDADAVSKGSDDGFDPSALTMSELADHIEATHHQWLRHELPRMAMIIGKVADAHGERDPRLDILRNTFENFAYEIFSHMQKEERILFPAVRRMEVGAMNTSVPAVLEGPLAEMVQEHDEAGAALLAMRELTDDFAVPANACITHRAMIDALRTLEADMHLHVHKENNVLFPRVRAATGLSDQ